MAERLMTETTPWLPDNSQQRVNDVRARMQTHNSIAIAEDIAKLANRSNEIHTRECFNLNPATNVMNPRAEALLGSGIGTRPSLGYPAAKYETGLEASEEIEIITERLCCEIFDARFAEIRVPSGALANMYGFMACCKPGDTIIAPPASIAGHVTHHDSGCAGLYGLNIIDAPVDASGYTVDLNALETLAMRVKPTLITLGGSLNLFEHPVRQVREIADRIGATLLFDAAHQCGIIAGRAWHNPLAEGAHLMTMSTYKSLGGPAGGLIVSNDAQLMQRIDQIAFPGMTANFDVARTAALSICMLDWREHGRAYAAKMISVAKALANHLNQLGLPVFAQDQGYTRSHQFAIDARTLGGGQHASQQLRQAGFLTCGIGLPVPELDNDLNGLRLGTPEVVRFGVNETDTKKLAELMHRALHSEDPASLASETGSFRQQFDTLHYILE